MCAAHQQQKKLIFSTPLIYALMIGLGIASGMSNIVVLKETGLLLSDLFIKIFKCISLPIISLSIIVTLANYKTDGYMKKIWQRTIKYTFSTTVLAAVISCLLYLIIQPSSVQVNLDAQAVKSGSSLGYFGYLANIIPTNLLSPFLEQQVMGVLFLSIIIGVAVRQIPDVEARDTLTLFFRGAHAMFLVMTRWIIKIIPLGLFGFITSTVVQLRSGMDIKGIGEYLLIVVLANLVQGFVILPLWLKMNNIRPFAAMRSMLPALSVAFFSKSSVGTLPVTMNTIENNLQVKPAVSRFVLPLCTSINMNGCAAFIFATVIYLMQNHGMPISYSTMVLWVFVATVAAIGNAGVPMGCFFLSISLLSSMNVPIVLMGVILPFYGLIDMLETALNVWSDACVTKIVNDKALAEAQEELQPRKRAVYEPELG
ncbi:dicarboxylate/amino acid:cation symporter [Fluoribacter dumoffii]|uniref:Glutamate-aspartate carrier protein n=1 Tax=Fluoribacter dumoffii TaxID=463 RepID=A0A377GDA0_9GAMM|nr:dicarboxylate/amino acid:cation symporter [Fluoribacter dumoffii]KTC90588.1 amino acid transporter [Fluoribacter dumoffii NY 23]MCW8419319.1 dicarboxylate/amino acid:cation symporter [Fluoribacter dumoffii]MCW8452806.1 dicarboxylate/amino acid:cation symporter [Fluoribacter dumoffii]MCW8459944.1 dicarboxylate/amino acid:cation symporter [Fluoribacter dumoffii]MCW8483422.1 dicarboxylate/amino acid:cation symporter [Fluoribacter dumoffii]